MHRYLDLQTIDPTHVLDQLKKVLVDINDNNEESTTEKRKSSIKLI